MPPRDPDSDTTLSFIQTIEQKLTPLQKQCLKDLGERWMGNGYSKTQADLLVATSNLWFKDRFDPLVECSLDVGNYSTQSYQHRLLPLGLVVKRYLEISDGKS